MIEVDAPLDVFAEGDALFDAMLHDIELAGRSIRLESYIFASDRVGLVFVDALCRCARRGVNVTLRADHVGSWLVLRRAEIERMRGAGVQFEWSRIWSARRPWVLNRRNHRKLLVVDDATAFLGGFNIHAPSSWRAVGEQRWRDTHVCVRGESVAAAALVFDRYRNVPPDWLPPVTRARWLLPNQSKACRHRLRCVLRDALHAARSRVWATTPYFVPDSYTQKLLCDAAGNGADVRLLVPGKTDVPVAQWAARAAYSRLLARGVRIYEYLPRVLHAKTLLVDDDWATVGTANLDYRSLFVNDELNLIDETGELNAMLGRMFVDDLVDAEEVLALSWNQRRWARRLGEAIGWSARRWL